MAVGDGDDCAGPDKRLGNGFSGGLGGVGAVTENSKKRTSAITTRAVGTASRSAPLVGRAPVF